MPRSLRHTERVVLNLPIERTYDYLADPRNDVEWYHGVRGSRQLGEGLYEQTLSMMGIKYHSRIRISEENPPHGVVLTSVDSPISFEARYRFVSLTPETTEFTMAATVHVAGPFRVFGPVFPVLLRRRVGQNFARLAALLNARNQIA